MRAPVSNRPTGAPLSIPRPHAPVARTLRKVVVLGLIGTAPLLSACPFSPDPANGGGGGGGEEYLKRTSIHNVLANLLKSYEQRNKDQYVVLLADDFLYEFAPQDVGTGNNIPEDGIWGLADETVSADRMFSGQPNLEGYRAETITLDFTEGTQTVSDKNDQWQKVTLSQVNLRVDTVHPEKGTLTYLVQGDRAVLHFKQTDEVDPDSHQRLWKIAYWEDKPIRALAAARS